MQHEPLKERARGRWPGILVAIGVPAKALRNRHGPCPICGGKDRFRFDDQRGTGSFYCSQCGPGDGIELVMRFRGLDFKQAALLIEQHIGAVPVLSSKIGGSNRGKTDAQQREQMTALWKRARPITLADPAGRYLQARTGLIEFPSCLRVSPDERYCDQGAKPSWHPVMLAKVEPSDTAVADGARAAIHRTYLDDFGNKADVPSPRKMLGMMPPGAAVRLMPHQHILGIAEGIETALSAAQLFNVPVWAALTKSLLADWTPPPGVKIVMVFGDNDASFAGQAAAFSLAERLRAKGLTTLVELPLRSGQDWNDVHRERLSSRGANVLPSP